VPEVQGLAAVPFTRPVGGPPRRKQPPPSFFGLNVHDWHLLPAADQQASQHASADGQFDTSA
jgi:hypothetical protein